MQETDRTLPDSGPALGDRFAVPVDARPAAWRMTPVVAFLGACFVAIRAGLPYAPVLWFAALRAVVGGAVLAAIALGLRRRLPRGWAEWTVIIALGLANATIGGATMFAGTAHLATGISSVLANAQPLLIVLPAWALYGERPSRRTVVGLGVGFAGLIVVAVPGGGGTGAALELASAGAATAGTLLARRLGTIDNLVAGGWSFLTGGLALTAWAGISEGPPHIRWDPRFVAILAFLGVLGTAAVYLAWYTEARRCPLYRLAGWTFAVPVFGLVIALIFEGEQPSATTATGITIVVASLWLVLKANRPDPNLTSTPHRRRYFPARVLRWRTSTASRSPVTSPTTNPAVPHNSRTRMP